jgi:tRNA(Ile)-lysidine synthase
MLERFKDFVQAKKLFEPDQRILLAVSGGTDSMLMLHLFEKSGFNYGVVHCNFQLRGSDSDEDERFVESHVLSHGVRYFSRRFDTIEHARIHGISIEMAARELRYRFFEEVRIENNFDYVATAHHRDDLLETFFLNLSRKTGIKGLSGIKEKTARIIRPLLFATRWEIEDFARIHSIDRREDHTNSEVVYQRNFIRHRILPVLSELNPAFKNNLFETITNLREAEEIYSWFLNGEKNKVVFYQEDDLVVDVNMLLESPFPKALLFEILTEYNFHPKVIEQVFAGLNSAPGKTFYSGKYRLIKDRRHLYLTPVPTDKQSIYYIEEGDMELFAPLDLVIQQFSSENFQLVKSSLVACIDAQKIEFPLLIRKWEKGDYFQPLGMSGFKKVSDFLIDEKIPLHQKENVWLLCSGQKIIWIMGHRLDNRFKITSGTKKVLQIEITGN